MICCVSTAKMYFEHQNFVISCSFALFVSIFKFFRFSMILRAPHCQIRLRVLISCPEQLPNQSRLEFHIYSNFLLHVVFMCRPCAKLFSSALPPQNLKPRSIDSIFNIVLISHSHYVFEFSNFEHVSDYHPNLINFALKLTPGDESQLAEKPPQLTPYYSLSLYLKDICSTSHSNLTLGSRI